MFRSARHYAAPFSILCGLLAWLTLIENANSAGVKPSGRVDPRLVHIDHWIIIYQENWSFDGLYGKFPGADGLANAGPAIPQVDRDDKRLANFPEPSSDPNIPPALPIGLVDLAQYVDPAALTKDLAHLFYMEQLQIDAGRLERSSGTMDKFVAWSSNPNLVMSYYDATAMPEGRLAQQYLLCDHFFHAAFGGSFLNHQFLVAAQAPRWRQPSPKRKTFVSSVNLKVRPKILDDQNLTVDGRYVVNTTFSAVAPHASLPPYPPMPSDELMRSINNVDPTRDDYVPTIGNRLDDAGISWRWYAGGWADALAGKQDTTFQCHHQPLAYYAKYAPFLDDSATLNPKTTGPSAHLQDGAQFYIDLAEGKLPAVSFLKSIGALNEHPGYASVLPGQQHVADIVHAVQNSSIWRHTAIIITYDEHGGRWDHVPPPHRDQWGPGCRVPTIVISPYTWRGGVEHITYDTLSILKTLEERYHLPPLNKTDAAARSMVECFQDAAHAAIDVAYTQPDAERPCHSVLVVGGTPWADQIHISNEDIWTVVRIRSSGNVTARRSKFRTSHLSRIEVYGQGGDDNIQIESPVTLPALVLCGSGNNFVRTGGGPSIVVASGGESAIEGGTGRNVLIGGQSRANLKAGPRGDILIAGSTDYDADVASLRTILRAWAAPDVAYADRVARLSGKQADQANVPLLSPVHIHRSRGGNVLEGGPNFDWYIGHQDASHGDEFKNRAAGEVITGI